MSEESKQRRLFLWSVIGPPLLWTAAEHADDVISGNEDFPGMHVATCQWTWDVLGSLCLKRGITCILSEVILQFDDVRRSLYEAYNSTKESQTHKQLGSLKQV